MRLRSYSPTLHDIWCSLKTTYAFQPDLITINLTCLTNLVKQYEKPFHFGSEKNHRQPQDISNIKGNPTPSSLHSRPSVEKFFPPIDKRGSRATGSSNSSSEISPKSVGGDFVSRLFGARVSERQIPSASSSAEIDIPLTPHLPLLLLPVPGAADEGSLVTAPSSSLRLSGLQRNSRLSNQPLLRSSESTTPPLRNLTRCLV